MHIIYNGTNYCHASSGCLVVKHDKKAGTATFSDPAKPQSRR